MEQEALTLTRQDHILRASLHCEIDHHTAKPIRTAIDAELVREVPDLLILDFAGVRFMDSSGIGLILGRAQHAGECGCQVRVEGLSPTLCRLVSLSGVEKVRNITVAKN